MSIGITVLFCDTFILKNAIASSTHAMSCAMPAGIIITDKNSKGTMESSYKQSNHHSQKKH